MNPGVVGRLIAVSGLLVAVLSMLAIPHMTHRDLLFGVPVPRGFRSTETGRNALRSYRLWIALPAAVSLIGAILIPNSAFNVVALLSMVVVGVTAFVTQNRKLKPFAIQPLQVREVDLGPPQPLPWFVWLGILPLAFLVGAALYLHSHWDQIPERFPVHFDINLQPNRWATRSIRGVYGPLAFGGELAVLMFGLALAGWYGSRRSDPMRKPVLVVLLVAEAVVALVCGQIPLRLAAGLHIPVLVMVFGPLLLLAPAIAYAIRENNKPREPVDPTPNECWKGGVIYYNPNDAALFVQRRDGLGFTVNLANRWSWAIYGGLLLVIGSAPFVLGN